MRLRVLGSAAGGGFPQWNCGCRNCVDVRSGDAHLSPRTQDSLAVSSDGNQWFLVNASPDIRTQIESFPLLHPRTSRQSPMSAIILTNGDLDHVLGLFSLRESEPLLIYATDRVRRGLALGNAIFRTLERFPEQVTWRALEIDREVPLAGRDGKESNLLLRPIAATGKLPVHLDGSLPPSREDNIGLLFRDRLTKRSALYLSAAATLDDVAPLCDEVDCLLLDGTFWSNDELPSLGLGTKRADEMAHLPVGGKNGSLAKLANCKAPKKIFTHINNTNPMLRDDSAERREVERAGWTVATDGMEITL